MLYIRVSLIPDAHVQYAGKYLVVFFLIGLKKTQDIYSSILYGSENGLIFLFWTFSILCFLMKRGVWKPPLLSSLGKDSL